MAPAVTSDLQKTLFNQANLYEYADYAIFLLELPGISNLLMREELEDQLTYLLLIIK